MLKKDYKSTRLRDYKFFLKTQRRRDAKLLIVMELCSNEVMGFSTKKHFREDSCNFVEE